MVLQWYCMRVHALKHAQKIVGKSYATSTNINLDSKTLTVLNKTYPCDDWTNISSHLLSKLGVNLHNSPNHPLCLVRQQIVNFFYQWFRSGTGSPVFSHYNNINPVVSVEENFDSLLVPKDHPSRAKTDCYYLNRHTLLRAHTTAHQAELMSAGLNNFIIVGDVYRRDEIDSTHYPVFHQCDAVRMRTMHEIFESPENSGDARLFERGEKTESKQACHTLECARALEKELKNTLVALVQALFREDVSYRWVNEYFPFTHPSWELEVYFGDKWVEVLGCGIMRQEILTKCGVEDRVGWAFGLGLERLAMCLYQIPDIRLFWSTDSGFLSQFTVTDPSQKVIYKPVSAYPQCMNDISFWLPTNGKYSENDFFDIVRDVGGDCIEQIVLKDQFTHPKTEMTSYCYTIIYRHMGRTLRKFEVNEIHRRIGEKATEKLNVKVRR